MLLLKKSLLYVLVTGLNKMIPVLPPLPLLTNSLEITDCDNLSLITTLVSIALVIYWF